MYPLAAFEVNGKPYKFDSVTKKLDYSLLALQTTIQKAQLAEKVFTTVKMIGNWLLSHFRFFNSYRVKEISQAKVGVGLE